MSSLVYIFFFIAASSTFANKVPVTVYYESLCPDSIKFYTSQLYPAWDSSLRSFMELVLVPYGKSSYTFDGQNYTFTCHHGEKECEGNKVQACALKLIADMDMQVKYINCLMTKTKASKEGEYPTKSCASDLQLAGDIEKNIEDCAASNDGNKYLAELGNMTMKFQEPLKSVPSVVFNNKMDNKDIEALSNFKSVLCSYITEGKPAECNNNGASAAYPAVLLIALLFGFALRW